MMKKNIAVNAPIFLIGMPRSGTSIISEAISLHHDLGWFSNYIRRFPRSPWVCLFNRMGGMPGIGPCLRGRKRQGGGMKALVKHLLPYADEAFSAWELLCGEKFSWEYLLQQNARDDEREKTIAYIAGILMFHGKRRFFSKLTGPPRIHYLNTIFPDAYYIHIIRDPRAVVSSLMSFSYWKEYGGLDRPFWQKGFPDEYARQWIESGKSPVALNALQWKWVAELTWQEKNCLESSRYIEIRYEDFAADPHVMLTNIFNETGLRDSKTAHRHLDSIGKVQDMNYKFRKNMSRDDIRLIERLTHDTAGKAGYRFE